jgi:hypothetical protein
MIGRVGKAINEIYLEDIRSMRCLVCGKMPVDPHHVMAVGTKQSKRNDYTASALCREHHTEVGSGLKKFEEKYHVNLWQEVFVNFYHWVRQEHGLSDTGHLYGET